MAKQVAELGLSGVHMRREYRRYYPTGEVAAHVVGFTNVDDVGQEGVELAFEEALRGSNGSKRVIKDRYGQIIEEVEYIKAPSDGAELVLSLDRRIQFLAYRALKTAVHKHGALGGSVVVLDSRTGEVLAMANQPAYNPNNRARSDRGAFSQSRRHRCFRARLHRQAVYGGERAGDRSVQTSFTDRYPSGVPENRPA